MVPTSTRAHEHTSTRAHEHTSTRAHEHTSTRAHEHTSTRAHDTQPIPPQKNLTIRGSTSPAAAQKYVTNTHQDAPPYRAAPQKTPHPTPRLKRRQWARSSPQHTRKKDMPNPPPRRNRLATNQRAQTVVHYTPNTPCHPHTTEVDCTLSNPPGGFATIDPSTGTRPWPIQATTRGVLRP